MGIVKGILVALSAIVILSAVWSELPIEPSLLAQTSGPEGTDLQVLSLRSNVRVIVGAGAHITVQTGDDGAIVVNSGTTAMAPRVLAAIRQMTPQPIRYIVNTNGDPESVGGNEAIARAGQWFGAPMGRFGVFTGFGGGASIVATEAVAARMANGTPAYPLAAVPSEAFSRRKKLLRLNGEGIQFVPFAKAHSEEDLIVLFRASDVVVTGNLLDMTRFPIIDVEGGGTIDGWLAALNEVKDMVIPELPLAWRDGGTLVVPAHGRIAEKDEVVQYRDMVTIIRDVVGQMKKDGMSVDAVIAAQPAKGYSGRYGREPGSTDGFVRAIYATVGVTR